VLPEHFDILSRKGFEKRENGTGEKGRPCTYRKVT
jgi:hypothetical protein